MLISTASYTQSTKLLDFDGTANGSDPRGDLISDGIFLYGMTRLGGTNDMGTIFKIMPDGSNYVKLLDFTGAANGSNPQGSLFFDGTFLYGTTVNGGSNNLGTIFKIMPDGTNYVKLLDFTVNVNGKKPHGTLISDGTFLYGMTREGGTNALGTIFKIMPDGTGFLKLFDFSGTTSGSSPNGSLILDGSFLYGMTPSGGTSNMGTIFKIMPNGTGFINLLNFTGFTNGKNPTGSLISDGTFLYGLTSAGGNNNMGTIFKIMPNGTGFQKLFDFDGNAGLSPKGTLISIGNQLYGLTESGGANQNGTIFKIMPDGTGFIKLFDFSGLENGNHSQGSLFSDGSNLYGMTMFGGLNNLGVVFKNCIPSSLTLTETACNSYTLNSQTYTLSGTYTQQLTNSQGCDSIILLNLTINSNSVSESASSCDSYTWSANGTTYNSSGIYSAVLTNALGCDSIVTLNLTVNNSNSSTDNILACDSLVWIDGNTYYTSNNNATHILTNLQGCDSIITLNLTVTPSLPLTVNTFSIPSDANNCIGALAVTANGNANFNLNLDAGTVSQNSTGYSLISNICPGIHTLQVTDNCNDTLTLPIVIPVDSNYVFNNPFIDSIALDSLGQTIVNCDIYYNSIDTAFIDSVFATGNTVTVVWNIIDSNGSNFDTSTYILNNGNGVYFLQLNIYCPSKSIEEFFTITQSYYYESDIIGIEESSQNQLNYLKIYPNPTDDNVTIKMPHSYAIAEIIDINGKILRTFPITNGQSISFSQLESGIYYLRINTEQNTSTNRIVKN